MNYITKNTHLNNKKVKKRENKQAFSLFNNTVDFKVKFSNNKLKWP